VLLVIWREIEDCQLAEAEADLRELIQSLESAAETESGSPADLQNAYLYNALVLSLRGNTGDALSALYSALHDVGGPQWGVSRLGYGQASRFIDKTTELSNRWNVKQKSDYFYLLCIAYKHMEEDQHALDSLRRAASYDHDAVPAAARLRSELYDLGLWAECETWYKRGLAIRPDDPQLLSEYSFVVFQRGRETEGLRGLERAASISSTNLQPQIALAMAYCVLGRNREAESIVRKTMTGNYRWDVPLKYVSLYYLVDGGRLQEASRTLDEVETPGGYFCGPSDTTFVGTPPYTALAAVALELTGRGEEADREMSYLLDSGPEAKTSTYSERRYMLRRRVLLVFNQVRARALADRE
jgi:tetratricopeptide (TPR) repeat protein